MLHLFKWPYGQRQEVEDLSFLETDVHSHLVPGVDDGADRVEDSLELVRSLVKLGFKKLITTPHVRADYYPNSRDALLDSFERLQRAVEKARLGVELFCAAEYYVDTHFEKLLDKEPLLTFPGDYVLLELSSITPPLNLYEILFRIQSKGYRPIIAHPERYVYLIEAFEEVHRLKDNGCLLQLNLLSPSGYYGRQIMKGAQRLLKAGMIDLLGTDLHHLRHLDAIDKMLRSPLQSRWLRKQVFLNKELTQASGRR